MATSSTTGHGQVLKRANKAKLNWIIHCATAIITLMGALILFAMYAELNSLGRIGGRRFSNTEEVKFFLSIFSFVCLAIGIITGIQMLALKKIFICVCEKGIYGIAGKTYNFTTQPFDIQYNQITEVKTRKIKNVLVSGLFMKTGTMLVIECSSNIYECPVENTEVMRKMIADKIDQADF